MSEIKNIFVGIDISKEQLDFHIRPLGKKHSFKNKAESFPEIIRLLQNYPPELIVLESTGGFERGILQALSTAQLPVVMVNAKKVRAFAVAVGVTAKTDAIDAAVIAHFAEAVRPEVRALPEKANTDLADLNNRRNQLINILTAEKNRLDRASQVIQQHIEEHIKWLKDQIALLDQEIDKSVEQNQSFKEKEELLQTAPGVGPVLSHTLIAELPELGTVTNKQIAALVGVAPYQRESGSWKGKAFI